MADDSLIRHENLLRLGLTARELSERVGGRYTYWRDMLAGKKSFGEKIARKIEEKLGLVRMSLDLDEGAAPEDVKPVAPTTALNTAKWTPQALQAAVLVNMLQSDADRELVLEMINRVVLARNLSAHP